MSANISAALRRLVYDRAGGCCEYCLIPEALSLHRHEPDHIVPRQHGGVSEPGNLALACMRCNRHKGPNVGSFDPITGRLTPFFNPRTQSWIEHFVLMGDNIKPFSAEGRVTASIMRFNDSERVAERRLLRESGFFD